MKNRVAGYLEQWSRYLFLGLLAYMPLHILISTWLGTSFGLLDIARVAKDVVLVVGAGVALYLAVQKGVVRAMLQDRLLWLMAGFGALNLVLALIRNTDMDAEFLGLVYNTRFLVFFVWAMLLVRLQPKSRLLGTAVQTVLISGAITVMFGIVQYVMLPNDALRHIGYTRANGVLPVFFIDEKPDLERIMSTVRDPNSYGSYLIIIISLLASGLIFTRRRKALPALYLLLSTLCLFWTFSRSAWIGTLAAFGVLAMFFVVRYKEVLQPYKKRILALVVSILVLAVAGLGLFWNSYWVQNVVFHADQSTVLEDPNQLRVRFWQESLQSIVNNPLGGGPGTAGLASIRNDQKTVLNENYYLQTGQELGILGLLLFLIILAMVAARIYRLAKQYDPYAIALLASLAGLLITNFLVHIWANEAVAYTWWGLAGLVIATSSESNKTYK